MTAALMTPSAQVIHGDCREELRRLETNSIYVEIALLRLAYAIEEVSR